jgi:RNA polymerase sigma-70 factor (ECF subfamily)
VADHDRSICLDTLRLRQVRRGHMSVRGCRSPRCPGCQLSTDADPAETAVRGEQVGLALLVVLEGSHRAAGRVRPATCSVLLDAIGAAIGTSARTVPARLPGRRAIGEVRQSGPVASDLGEQQRVLGAFLDAANRGDLAELARVLAPDVELIGDGGGLAPAIRRPLVGAEQVSRFYLALVRQAGRGQPILAESVIVNGDLGFVLESGGTLMVIAPVVVDGLIARSVTSSTRRSCARFRARIARRATWHRLSASVMDRLAGATPKHGLPACPA